MNRTIGKVYVDAVITDEQYKERMTLVHEANERMDELQAENAKLRHDLEEANNQAEEVCIENAKLRELVVALYHINFGNEEESWDAWEDFCPCGICEERHGGEAPCAYATKDLADECCEPITKEIVIDRMRKLGIEVDE